MKVSVIMKTVFMKENIYFHEWYGKYNRPIRFCERG